MTLVDGPSLLKAFERRIEALLPRLAYFDAEDYLAMHPDLAGLDPYRHFSEHGVWEQRRCITPEHLSGQLSRATALAESLPLSVEAMERAYCAATSARGIIYCPARPSDQERRIAERLSAVFDAAGLDVPIKEGAPRSSARGAIIVGPERLFSGARKEADLALYSAALMVISDSPDSATFGEQLPYLLAGAGVIAVESETYALCQDAAIPALWLGTLTDGAPKDRHPTDHPLYLGLSRAVRASAPFSPWAERPIDVLAIESASPSRANAWGRMSDGMTRFKSVVYQPPVAEALNEDEAVLRRYLYARSKIVLHLHEAAPSALSSALIEEAAAAQALILSEPARPHLLIKQDRHYFESSARRMPAVLERLIREEGGAEIAAAATDASRRALASAFDPESMGLALINLLADAAERS